MRGVTRAAWGSVLFFLAAPAVVAGVVPWSITRYTDLADTPVAVLGLALVALGLAALIACFVQFVREGRGTPAPIAPTEAGRRRALPLGAEPDVPRGRRDDPRAGGRVRQHRGPGLVRAVRRGCGVVRGGVRATDAAQDLRPLVDAYCRAVPAWRPRLTPWEGAGRRPATQPIGRVSAGARSPVDERR